MKVYLGIDIETTGQNLFRNAMIEIGASLMDETGEEIENVNLCLEMPPGTEFEKKCLDTFWIDHQEQLMRIKNLCIRPKIQMMKFADWIDKLDLKYGASLEILGDFALFDFAWINVYLSRYTDRPCLYNRAVRKEDGSVSYEFRRITDTNERYRGTLMITNPGAEEGWRIEEKLGIQNTKWGNDHYALNDARNIAANWLLYLKKYKK